MATRNVTLIRPWAARKARTAGDCRLVGRARGRYGSHLRGAVTCYTDSERRLMLIIRGAGRMPDHRDKPATALAHGAAKCSDIERVRQDVDEADARSVRSEEIS